MSSSSPEKYNASNTLHRELITLPADDPLSNVCMRTFKALSNMFERLGVAGLSLDDDIEEDDATTGIWEPALMSTYTLDETEI